MATCPACGVRGREDPGAFRVDRWLRASPLGTFSLAGQTVKVSARWELRLICNRCGWSIAGRLGEESFEGDPFTQIWPDHETGKEG